MLLTRVECALFLKRCFVHLNRWICTVDLNVWCCFVCASGQVRNQGTLNVNGSYGLTVTTVPFFNDGGTLLIGNAQNLICSAFTQLGSGAMTVLSSSTSRLQGTQLNFQQGSLQGFGTVQGQFILDTQASVRPGRIGSAVPIVFQSGNSTLRGLISIVLSTATPVLDNSFLDVRNLAILNGASIDVSGPVTPAWGTNVTVLRHQGLVGSLASVTTAAVDTQYSTLITGSALILIGAQAQQASSSSTGGGQGELVC